MVVRSRRERPMSGSYDFEEDRAFEARESDRDRMLEAGWQEAEGPFMLGEGGAQELSQPAETMGQAYPGGASELGEAPFAKTGLEAPGTWSEASGESPTTLEGAAFPSGLVLQTTSGATGRDQEHWDPHATGLPLLATEPWTHPKRLSQHFTVKELVSSGGRAASVARISPTLVRVLEAIRERAGKRVRITSGYRSWARNKQVYAARGQKPPLSRHCSGQAVDLKIAGMTGVQIAQLAIDAAGTELGLGIGPDYIHVDVRGRWAPWTYMRGAAGKAA